MVGEFDELQGIMGEKYALLAGEDAAVATAIREHYLPDSADGALPETKVGAILALADKLDTLLSFFSSWLDYHQVQMTLMRFVVQHKGLFVSWMPLVGTSLWMS